MFSSTPHTVSYTYTSSLLPSINLTNQTGRTLGTNNDFIIVGHKLIIASWPSLEQAGFRAIDSCLPNPANKDEAYFFSGEYYVLVKVNPGSFFSKDLTGGRLPADAVTFRQGRCSY